MDRHHKGMLRTGWALKGCHGVTGLSDFQVCLGEQWRCRTCKNRVDRQNRARRQDASHPEAVSASAVTEEEDLSNSHLYTFTTTNPDYRKLFDFNDLPPNMPYFTEAGGLGRDAIELMLTQGKGLQTRTFTGHLERRSPTVQQGFR
jgi:hypothetical protein